MKKTFLTIIVPVVQLVGIIFISSFVWFMYLASCAVGTSSSHGSYVQDWIEFNTQNYPVVGGIGLLCAVFTIVRLWIALGKKDKKLAKG